MSDGEQIPEKDPRGELSDEAWAIYVDLVGKYDGFLDSEKGLEARRKNLFRQLEELENREGPEPGLPEMAIVLLNATSNWAAYHALRAVAAYLAEHPER